MAMDKANGILINYDLQELGGHCVTFLHGFSMGLGMWDGQFARPVSGYRYLRYDLRGQGATEAPTDPSEYSQLESVKDLRDLLRALAIEKTVLVGLSNGGNIALHFAIAHPEMVEGLVICDTGAGSDSPRAWADETEGWAKMIEKDGVEVFADHYLRSEVLNLSKFFKRHPSAFGVSKAAILKNSPHGLIHTLRSTVGTRPGLYSLEDDLTRIRAPTMIIVGDRDHLCIRPGEFLASTIPSAQFHLIEDCGHMTNIEREDEFNSLLERFLVRIAS